MSAAAATARFLRGRLVSWLPGSLLADEAERSPRPIKGGEAQALTLNRIDRQPLLRMAGYLEAQRRLCLLRVDLGARGTSYGSGFLVGPDLVLTCQHVLGDLPAGAPLAQVSCLFDHVAMDERLAWRSDRKGAVVADRLVAVSPMSRLEHEYMDQKGFGFDVFTLDSYRGPCLDFALLRLSQPVGRDGIEERGGLSLRGWIDLAAASGTDAPAVRVAQDATPGTLLVCLQFPKSPGEGIEPGKLSDSLGACCGFLPAPVESVSTPFYRILYDAGTDQGSSGGLVLTSDGNRPVALHHMGWRQGQASVAQHRPDGGEEIGLSPVATNQGVPLHHIVEEIKAQAPAVWSQMLLDGQELARTRGAPRPAPAGGKRRLAFESAMLRTIDRVQPAQSILGRLPNATAGGRRFSHIVARAERDKPHDFVRAIGACLNYKVEGLELLLGMLGEAARGEGRSSFDPVDLSFQSWPATGDPQGEAQVSAWRPPSYIAALPLVWFATELGPEEELPTAENQRAYFQAMAKTFAPGGPAADLAATDVVVLHAVPRDHRDAAKPLKAIDPRALPLLTASAALEDVRPIDIEEWISRTDLALADGPVPAPTDDLRDIKDRLFSENARRPMADVFDEFQPLVRTLAGSLAAAR